MFIDFSYIKFCGVFSFFLSPDSWKETKVGYGLLEKSTLAFQKYIICYMYLNE